MPKKTLHINGGKTTKRKTQKDIVRPNRKDIEIEGKIGTKYKKRVTGLEICL